MVFKFILICLTFPLLIADGITAGFAGPEIYDGNWNPRSVSAYGNRWQYTGQEWWPELGLHNYKARFYSPELGRFLQNDPLRFEAGDLNLYRYVGNNVVNATDPDGELVWFVPILIFAAKMAVDYGVELAIDHAKENYLTPEQQVWAERVEMAHDAYQLGSGNIRQIGKTVLGAVKKDGDEFLKKKAAKNSNEGVYEFPDQKSPAKKDYVGQSQDMDSRLAKHKRDGRLQEGTETRTEVTGGKTNREIAEHRRIQEKTGGVPARQSDAVTNKRDPIGPKRRQLLEDE